MAEVWPLDDDHGTTLNGDSNIEFIAVSDNSFNFVCLKG